VNVLQALIFTEEEKMLLTPTYHVFKMYKVHHDALLLPVVLESPDYEYNGMALPMISASASRSADGIIHISIVNIDPHQDNQLAIDVRGADVSSVTGRILTAEKINSLNTFEDPDRVRLAEFKDLSFARGMLQVTMPAKSIVVLEIE